MVSVIAIDFQSYLFKFIKMHLDEEIIQNSIKRRFIFQKLIESSKKFI